MEEILNNVCFCSDGEVSAELDNLLLRIGNQAKADDESVGILNPIRVAQMRFCLGVMRFLTTGQAGIEVTYKMNQPFRSMGSVSVVGHLLRFQNSEWFSRAAEFADNTEVYVMSDGKVKLTFTFHGIVKKL